MQIQHHVSDTDLIIKGHKLTVSVQGQLFAHIESGQPIAYVNLPKGFNTRDGLSQGSGNTVIDANGNILKLVSKRDNRHDQQSFLITVNGQFIGRVTL